jgi:hypothetical protein
MPGDQAAIGPRLPSYDDRESYAAAMRAVQVVLLVLHLVGVAALLVGLLVQVRRPVKRVIGPMRDGSGTAFLAGLLLVGVLEIRDAAFDHTQVSVMFGIGLAVLVLVLAGARQEHIPAWLWWLVLVLTVGNIGVAYAV